MSLYETAAKTLDRPRCWRCGNMVAWLLTEPAMIKCQKCKSTTCFGNVPTEVVERVRSKQHRAPGSGQPAKGEVGP